MLNWTGFKNYCINLDEFIREFHLKLNCIIRCSIYTTTAVRFIILILQGTAIRESAEMIQKENATISGVLIAIDRQEKGNNTQVSAVQQVSKDLGIPVISIITISDVIEYLRGKDGIYEKELQDMENYRREWGI